MKIIIFLILISLNLIFQNLSLLCQNSTILNNISMDNENYDLYNIIDNIDVYKDSIIWLKPFKIDSNILSLNGNKVSRFFDYFSKKYTLIDSAFITSHECSCRFFYRYKYKISDSSLLILRGEIKKVITNNNDSIAFNHLRNQDTFYIQFIEENIKVGFSLDFHDQMRRDALPIEHLVKLYKKYFPKVILKMEDSLLKSYGKEIIHNFEIEHFNNESLSEYLNRISKSYTILDTLTTYKPREGFDYMININKADMKIAFRNYNDSTFWDLRIKFPDNLIDTSQSNKVIIQKAMDYKDFQVTIVKNNVKNYYRKFLEYMKYFSEYVDIEITFDLLKSLNYKYHRDLNLIKSHYLKAISEVEKEIGYKVKEK